MYRINQWYRHIRIPKGLYFPIGVLMIFVVLTASGLNGSSSGVYGYLFGDHPERGLIAGEPRTVRSDEWVVNTPFLIAQTKNHFAMIDKSIGDGQDMSVVLDVPYADWSIVFRPQNLIFFILPLEFAFAFKWWSLAVLLLISIYMIVLEVYPKRYLLASLLALIFFFSPFIQWWYQSITILPIAYALLSVIIAHRLTITTGRRSKILYALALTYILAAFALIMYPAFQICAAIIALALFIAILHAHQELRLLYLRRNLLAYAGVISVVVAVIGSYIIQHHDVIATIQATVYPGRRNVSSGGLDVWSLLSWPFDYLLLDGGPMSVLGDNQSESSGFLLFGMVGLPLFMLLHRKRLMLSRLEKTLVLTIVLITTLMLLRMFVPFGDVVYALFGLNKVPLIRLILALGLVNLVALAVLTGVKLRTSSLGSPKPWWQDRSLYIFPVVLLVSIVFIWLIDHHYAIASVGIKEILAVAITGSVISSLLIHADHRIRMAGLGLLLLYGIASSSLINPLYKGLPVYSNSLARAVQSYELPNDGQYWTSDDDPSISSLLVSAGADVVGGVNTYPQRTFLSAFASQQKVVNRYAHIRIDVISGNAAADLSLIQADSYRLTVTGCDDLITKLRIRYIVSSTDQPIGCFSVLDRVQVGLKTLTIYRRS